MLLENVTVTVAAGGENPQTVNLEGETRSESPTDLIVFKGGFSTSDHFYKFEIKSDGTGKIFYLDFDSDEEEFSHEADLAELKAEIETLFAEEIELRKTENLSAEVSDLESARDEVAQERLEEFFWEEINSTLEDPFFRSTYDDLECGEEFHCENGTTKEFEEFLELCVMTERTMGEAAAEDYLIVTSETECEAAGLDKSSFYTERLGELVEIACEHFQPSGFRYDYNDGCPDRYSGYCESAESISLSVKELVALPARSRPFCTSKNDSASYSITVKPTCG